MEHEAMGLSHPILIVYWILFLGFVYLAKDASPRAKDWTNDHLMLPLLCRYLLLLTTVVPCQHWDFCEHQCFCVVCSLRRDAAPTGPERLSNPRSFTIESESEKKGSLTTILKGSSYCRYDKECVLFEEGP